MEKDRDRHREINRDKRDMLNQRDMKKQPLRERDKARKTSTETKRYRD